MVQQHIGPRQQVLLLLLLGIGGIGVFIMMDLLKTIFLAVTVAYVLTPFFDWLRQRRCSEWTAALLSTGAALVAGIAVFIPILVILYLRREQFLLFIHTIPDTITINILEQGYTVDITALSASAAEYVTHVAFELVKEAPVIFAKMAVFFFVVFGLLIKRETIHDMILAPIPSTFHRIVTDLHRTVKETLNALYLIQLTTAVATFLIAIPLFVLLGYPYPITLAVLAGILEFLPVVGPLFLVTVLAALKVMEGAVVGAVTVFVLGAVIAAFLPEFLLRPRLARHSAGIPVTWYIVGVTGGVLGLGAVGLIAGPLLVALFVAVVHLLAQEE